MVTTSLPHPALRKKGGNDNGFKKHICSVKITTLAIQYLLSKLFYQNYCY